MLAVVAVLSLIKLVFLAVWSGTGISGPSGSGMAETLLAAPRPAHAQGLAASVPGAWETAQGGAATSIDDPLTQAASQGDLSEEWRNLRRRQEEVQRQEQALRALENELDAKLDRLQALEARLQGMIQEADVLQDRKIRHLVDVYSNMKPREAARALEALEEPVAVKILSGMRGRNAGEVLSFVDSEVAARLTESLTRMQLPLQ